MNFSQFLELKFLDWQQREGGRKTVKEFAAYIGVSQSSISMWWTGGRSPEGENIQKIASKLGMEVYDILGIPRPDADLLYIQSNWNDLDASTRRTILEAAQKYKERNISAGHTTLVNSRIYLLVIKQIVTELKDIKSIKLPEPIDERPNLIKQIQELDRRKQRWMDAFETGSIDARDYADRVASLTAQADTNRDKLTTLESQLTKNQTTRQNITKLANTLSAFANYLIEAQASQINADLRLIISRIDIDKDNQPHITWG